MSESIDRHRDRFGVEPICRVLQVAPSGYRREAARGRDPARCPPRRQRDAALLPKIERVWRGNLQVYGADKVWKQLRREGIAVARCTVERLMRANGWHGVIRGKAVRTTVPEAKAPCPLDRVNREFHAERPNQLWVSDFTYVSTDLAGFRLRRLRHRCVRALHRRLAREPLDAHRLRARCTGAGAVREEAAA